MPAAAISAKVVISSGEVLSTTLPLTGTGTVVVVGAMVVVVAYPLTGKLTVEVSPPG
jgi:hypothetical protein